MSKRELKKYLSSLDKSHLEEQITDLYTRFKDVKEFYDFAFNPRESKLMEQNKFLISKEYFPVNTRKPKLRRSVAQRCIRHFKKLGVENTLIADLMLYNIEIAQTYSSTRPIKNDSFYSSMFKSFDEAVTFISDNGLYLNFEGRIKKIADETHQQNWYNQHLFNSKLLVP